MKKNKSTISHAESYREIGEFWDENDLSDFWEQTEPVEFEVEITSKKRYFPVEVNLSERISDIAANRGVSPETLLNLWLQERVSEEITVKN